MSFSSVGQNSAEEFFENILYATAYTEAQTQIRAYTNDIDNDVMQEALSSAMAVLSAGLIFMLLRKQEDVIQNIFDVAKGITIILLGSSFGQKMMGKLKFLKGTKLFKKMQGFKSAYSDRVATAQLVIDNVNNHIQADMSAQNETGVMNTVMQTKQHIVQKEQLNHSVGNSMASRYNETLMFKLFTKSFTDNDKAIIKKVLGRDTATELNIEDMNKIADFMFVTDTNGDVTGLSEQMFQLLNGLGYTNK